MFGSNNNSGSIFGGGSNDKKTGSIFDKKDDSKGGGSIFGGGSSGGGSIFDSKKDSKSSIFDTNNANPSEMFGNGNKKNETPSSMFGLDKKDNKNSSIFDKKDSSNTNGSIFGGNGNSEDTPKSIFGGNGNSEDTPKSIFGGSHASDKYDARSLDIRDNDKYSASYLSNDTDLTSLNKRGQNYGGMSLTDRMRGHEANRLNNDTDSVSLAEQYSDKALDKRAMGGLYNTTLSDIYMDKTKYAAHHGLDTDGMIDIKDNLYMVDTASEDIVEKSGFWGTDNTTEKMFDTGKDGGPIAAALKSIRRETKQGLFKEKEAEKFLGDGKADKSSESFSKYEKEQIKKKENEIKSEEIKRREKELLFTEQEEKGELIEEKEVKEIDEEDEEDILGLLKKKKENILEDEGISNKSNKEFEINENNIVFEKRIDNINIVIVDNNKYLSIGSYEDYKKDKMDKFSFLTNSFFRINNKIMHTKVIDEDIFCNIGESLDYSNNDFPFKFIMKKEKEAILNNNKTKIEETKENEKKELEKYSSKNIWSMISK